MRFFLNACISVGSISLFLFSSALAKNDLLTVNAVSAPGANSSGLPLPKRPRLTVPLAASMPKIDGWVDEKEWADATCFTGLVDGDTGFLSEEEFTGYIKSDGKNLYLAFQRKVRTVEELINNCSIRDSEVYYDDSWELYLYPMDENGNFLNLASKEGGGNFYHLIVNSSGAIFDQYKGDIQWNGGWRIEQRLERPNIWDMEMAIPLKELGIKEPNQGELFLFGFFFNQKTPVKRSLSWTTQMGLFANPPLAAVLNFSKDKSVVGLKNMGKPGLGLFAPVIMAKDNVPEMRISLILPDGLKISKMAGAEKSGQPIQFAPLQGNGRVLVEMISPAEATANNADFYYSAVVRYDSVPLTIKSTNYPSRKQVYWEINYQAMEKSEKVSKYKVSFDANSITVIERNTKMPWEKFCTSTANLVPGEYKAVIALLDANGQQLIGKTVDFTKEGKEPWLNNSIGIEKGYIPAPYMPMGIKNRTVQVIGRKIELSKTGLPEQIESKGIALLKSPIKLLGEINGNTAFLEANKAFEFTTIERDDSSGIAKVLLGQLSGTLCQTISFDGFCWYEIELSSPNKVMAKDVALEIRLPKEIVKSYFLTDPDLQLMEMKEWEGRDLLLKNLSLSFTPQVWLGNTQVGLAWLAESHKGWHLAAEKKAIEILLDNDSVVLRINIVDRPIELASPLKLAFGFQATPIKPVTDRQQRFIIAPNRLAEYAPESEVYEINPGQHYAEIPETFVTYAGLPEPFDPNFVLEMVERHRKEGVLFTPYCEFTWASLGLPEMKTYCGDWYTGEPWAAVGGWGSTSPEPFGMVDTENKDYQDFIVWRFVKNWKAYGGRSIYYDLLSPHQDKSSEHNRAYVSRSGKTCYPWPIRSIREIARRLCIAYRQKNPDLVIFGHASNMYLPVMAFTDAWPSGEYFTFVSNRYPEVLPYNSYRSWFYAYPFGLKAMFLPSMKSPGLVRADMSNYLAGIIFNHNTTVWLLYCDYGALSPYMQVYHGGNWSVQKFLPYWEYPKLTNLDPEKFKVSGWYNEKTKKGLLCIASISKNPITASVSLGEDWKFKDSMTLTDACKKVLETKKYVYPTALGGVDFSGDYLDLVNAGKIGGSYNHGLGEFKPYGVLMLYVE